MSLIWWPALAGAMQGLRFKSLALYVLAIVVTILLAVGYRTERTT
jgi:hypothetical protein